MFTEIKEMIDSTIYTNGRGEVTAQSVNLAMHGILDAADGKFTEVNDAVKAVEDKVTALEENGTGGSGALRVWMDEIINGSILSEKKAENALTYAAIKNGALDAMCVFEQELKSGIVYYETIRSSGIVIADTVVSVAITMEEDGTLVNYSINIGADGSTAIGA